MNRAFISAFALALRDTQRQLPEHLKGLGRRRAAPCGSPSWYRSQKYSDLREVRAAKGVGRPPEIRRAIEQARVWLARAEAITARYE